MPISGDVPKHLVYGARTGFLNGMRETSQQWQAICSTLNMDAKSIDTVDLGASPMPYESDAGGALQDFTERTQVVEPKDWTLITWLSHNALMDDQTGMLEARARGAGVNFQKHINKLVFQTLNGGDGATYGLCYDGQYFFDTDHKDEGAHYQTNQANKASNALSLDNFETGVVAVRTFYDDQGESTDYVPTIIIAPPALERTARNIIGNEWAYDTANREVNPYNGQYQMIVTPYFDSTAWVLLCGNEAHKPLIVALREQPNLQHAWFDPNGPDGGRYYFKFYARYNVVFGDWRLAYMGSS